MNSQPYQNIVRYIDSLIFYKSIRENDAIALPFNRLTEDELAHLAALFLEFDDRDTTECFRDSSQRAEDDDITCAFIRLLMRNCRDTRNDFADLVINRATQHYRKNIEEMIEERCSYANMYENQPNAA